MPAGRASGLLYAAASILLVSIAQLAMRWGMMRLPPVAELLAHASSTRWHLFAAGAAVGGLCCYAVSMISWIAALRRLPLRLAYPLLSISYVVVYLAAGLTPALAEGLSWTRSLGVLLVVCGVSVLLPDDEGGVSADAPSIGVASGM